LGSLKSELCESGQILQRPEVGDLPVTDVQPREVGERRQGRKVGDPGAVPHLETSEVTESGQRPKVLDVGAIIDCELRQVGELGQGRQVSHVLEVAELKRSEIRQRGQRGEIPDIRLVVSRQAQRGESEEEEKPEVKKIETKNTETK